MAAAVADTNERKMTPNPTEMNEEYREELTHFFLRAIYFLLQLLMDVSVFFWFGLVFQISDGLFVICFVKKKNSGFSLAPFLEKSGPVAPAVGAPEVATAGAVEAAIVPPVVASSSATDARSPGNENERRTSEIDNRQSYLIGPSY